MDRKSYSAPGTFKREIFTLLLGILLIFPVEWGWSQTPHLVVIGIDGLSPDGIRNAETPFIDSLCQSGSWSFGAQAVLPTSSSPNWASMISGAGPEAHGITSNAWKRKHLEGGSYCGQEPGRQWPTLFQLVHDQYPRGDQAIFHHWLSFGRLVEPGATRVKKHLWRAKSAAKRTASYFRRRKPLLVFVHLDHVDHAGHLFGHGTEKYFAAVEKADQLIGEILAGIDASGVKNETFVLVTADHGGIGKGHGGNTPEERTIPWILNGPDVRAGHEIQSGISQIDTAPTLARILRVKTPSCWEGKPVKEAFIRK